MSRSTSAATPGSCIECPPGTRRPATRPGPRCATHKRDRKRALAAKKHGEWILRTYGITSEDYQAIYEFQGGKCAICQRATGASKRLSVDHDHKTGEVRGLLCTPCNRDVLGHLRDSVSSLLRAVRYLLHPPARRALTRRRS